MTPDEQPAFGRSYQTPFADAIRNKTGIATIAVGVISSYDDVNSIILAGRADLCAIGRAHLYDPNWTLHAAAAQGYSGPGAAWPDQWAAGSRPPQTGRTDGPEAAAGADPRGQARHRRDAARPLAPSGSRPGSRDRTRRNRTGHRVRPARAHGGILVTIEPVNPPDLARPSGFAHAVVTTGGRLVFLAGQTALDASGAIVGDDVVAQFEQALGNLLDRAARGRRPPEHLTSLTIYATDLRRLPGHGREIGAVWRRLAGPRYPAMAAVGVSQAVGRRGAGRGPGLRIGPDHDRSDYSSSRSGARSGPRTHSIRSGQPID